MVPKLSESALKAKIAELQKELDERAKKRRPVIDKIIEGKLGSFYSQFVLVDQPFVRDDKVTIAQLVAQASAKTGENIQINRFVRFRVGDTE